MQLFFTRMSFLFTGTLLMLSLGFLKGQTLTTNLPIVIINTGGQSIPDEEKINVKMKLVDNGPGNFNTDTSTIFDFDGNIGIELRGSSSQIFPKKPYSIEVRDATNEDQSESFFGWPKESDYVLFASYNEKSLMHNVLTMTLARELGMYASRTKYVELILNGNYEGVYVFMEKIKRDKGRVDIDKLEVEENSGDDITGGYILKIDKFTGRVSGAFKSDYRTDFGKDIFFQYDTPKLPSIQQSQYIQGFMRKFENSLNLPNFQDSIVGYRKYIDVLSFVNYLLITEFTRNMDGYRISTYMHKDKDSKGGKLVMGPVWDYDICYGNADYCQGNRFDLYAFGFNSICPNDNLQVPFWWSKLISDPYFLDLTRKVYTRERENGIFKLSRINAVIDSLKNELVDAQARNYQRWPTLGQYIWPQPAPISNTWQGEIDELSNWISKRLDFLDNRFLIQPDSKPVDAENNIIVYPNPVDIHSVVFLPDHFHSIVDIRIYDALGRIVAEKRKYTTGFSSTFPISDVFDFQTLARTGIYFMDVIDLNLQRAAIKLVIR